jgi:hypothetical protein
MDVTFLARSKKGDSKKAQRKPFTACSVILGTFRKLADRNIFVHNTLSFKERDG